MVISDWSLDKDVIFYIYGMKWYIILYMLVHIMLVAIVHH